ncbi:MAG: cell division protein ZapA [Cycloclasticus sp.]|jgi:cell division protein ZapA|nr:MAG: Z-ring-associated protein ZapA [Neptuniibacter sp. Phe_28]MBV1913221.1 cell division protein ZapA [Cycloclasticus sp.]MDF1689659.1 cell division protein ZapA [Cycloclasticus sp.]
MTAPLTISLHILDKEYRVSCSEAERPGLESSARFLDEKMQSIKQSGRIVGMDRIAVMAGLNITHDFLVEEQKKSGLSLDISDKINALQNKLDFAINAFGK